MSIPTTELALPTSVSPSTWNADTAAMMEFAGLTWMEGVGDNAKRVFAPTGIMAAFIAACARTGLDPTAKQIYAAQMGGKWTVLVGIDGMRVVAQRTGQYDGQDPLQWQAEADGPWLDVPPKSPYSARVAIYRKGVGRPLVQTVTFAEFGGTGNNWTKRPSHMLGIRAESHGFRRAFPMELAGLYTPEDFEDGAPDDALIAEPTEDWTDLIHEAPTREVLDAIGERLKASGEGTDKIRAAWLARAGVLAREAVTVDADVIEDDSAGGEGAPTPPPAEESPEEYDARIAAEYDEAVAAGAVS